MLHSTKALSDVLRVYAPQAEAVWLCVFDPDERRVAMAREGEHWVCEAPRPGVRYGLRADGAHAPEANLWFDPAKLLVDPGAQVLDRAFSFHPALSAHGVDTANLVPKAVYAPEGARPAPAPQPARGRVVYEVNVRALTLENPEVDARVRGTVAALAHPSVLAHFDRLGVEVIELMPITAWIDERHLPPLGLQNRWGYNPVTFSALDPRLCPGGPEELRRVIETLHGTGRAVVLDVVYNHTGESDALGPTLSYRGLSPEVYAWNHGLVNHTGCGNTLDCAHPAVISDVLASLKHFASLGVDGFRFDLGPVLGRGPEGFDPHAPLLRALGEEPLLRDRTMIMEPWDIGPGGYQLGGFAAPTLEWNDRFRDDLRRFWKGESRVGELATRLSGSSDIYRDSTRSVNFVAAHDGFTLWDTTSFTQKHNEANGEDNRDGHNENHSWNHGVEGLDHGLAEVRRNDVLSLLALTLLARGTPMIGMGDGSGHSQNGNNNAYCQSFPLDWSNADAGLEAAVGAFARLRQSVGALTGQELLTDADVSWRAPDGGAPDWDGRCLAMQLGPVTLCINGSGEAQDFAAVVGAGTEVLGRNHVVPARAVHVFVAPD
ncbi:MAG: alpha-amylase family glycosyl hydrolase [Pseudomonadota bacterium]